MLLYFYLPTVLVREVDRGSGNAEMPRLRSFWKLLRICAATPLSKLTLILSEVVETLG